MKLHLKNKHFIQVFREIDIFATLFWNFKLFPFKIAKKFPIIVGHKVSFRGLSKGSIHLESSTIKTGMVRIGISMSPTFPPKGMYTMIRTDHKSTIIFGENITINKGCSLVSTQGGKVIIGNDVWINQCVLIFANSEIRIGCHTRIGWKSQIYDSAFHFSIDVKSGQIMNPKKPIYIGHNVWIGNHVTVSAGAHIPDFTIVAALSLVNKNFSNINYIGGLLVGQPAIYKECGKVRLLNDNLESKLKATHFSIAGINLADLGYNVYPIDPDLNLLYRSN